MEFLLPPVKYTRYFWYAPKTWVYRYPPPLRIPYSDSSLAFAREEKKL